MAQRGIFGNYGAVFLSNTEEQSGNAVNTEDTFQRDSVFHYSRERRLSRASQAVQDLNEGKIERGRLFRTLFANSSHRMILFVVVFVIAASGLASRFMGIAGEEDGLHYHGVLLGGNLLALAIFPIEETPFLVIMKSTPSSGEFFTGAVDVAVSPVMPSGREGGEAPQVFTHRIFFNLVESEMFQISLPFEETDFFVVLSTGEEQRTLRLQVSEN